MKMKSQNIIRKSAVCSLQSVLCRPQSSVSPRRQAAGFTLIELLMVVMVILMLSAILFKVAALVGDKTSRAKAIADIENIQNALNEYMAEYGTYPPTQGVGYEYDNPKLQPPVLNKGKDPGKMGYQYGLYAHLFERDGAEKYDGDTERDKAAKRRWAHYLKDLATTGWDQAKVYNDPAAGFGDQSYSNSYTTIWDPWSREYRYSATPPYLSYKLWSAGPDGADNSGDDISNASGQ